MNFEKLEKAEIVWKPVRHVTKLNTHHLVGTYLVPKELVKNGYIPFVYELAYLAHAQKYSKRKKTIVFNPSDEKEIKVFLKAFVFLLTTIWHKKKLKKALEEKLGVHKIEQNAFNWHVFGALIDIFNAGEPITDAEMKILEFKNIVLEPSKRLKKGEFHLKLSRK